MSKNRASEDMASEETIMTAAEYSESVYQWLQQAYQWQALAVGKYFLNEQLLSMVAITKLDIL